MADKATAARVPDLHKSAFWIYGVTAMVMREPLGTVLRHGATSGFGDANVQLEALRTLVVLLLMSRQFLVAGIYFDRVYLEPEAATRYPRRSYPLDFLAGMSQLLLAVGASTVVGMPSPIFGLMAAIMLGWELLWLLGAFAMGHSTMGRIAPGAVSNAVTLVVCLAVRVAFGEVAALALAVVMVSFQMVRLVRDYDKH